jgi:hypothetical protein
MTYSLVRQRNWMIIEIISIQWRDFLDHTTAQEINNRIVPIFWKNLWFACSRKLFKNFIVCVSLIVA